jgi:hypothetical protein
MSREVVRQPDEPAERSRPGVPEAATAVAAAARLAGGHPLASAAVRSLQRAVGNRATRRILGLRKPVAAEKRQELPSVKVSPSGRTEDGGYWRLEFSNWVTRSELVQALFKTGALPDGCIVEPTQKKWSDMQVARQWTFTWRGWLSEHLHEMTGYGKWLRERAVAGGDKSEEDIAYEKAQEAQRRARIREHLEEYEPALGMTGGEALQKLKPGVYVAAPGRPLRPIPPPAPDDSNPEVGWMRGYVGGGVFVHVAGSTAATKIRIREIGPYEQFWKWMIWYMQRGDDLDTAEKRYLALMDDLNHQMISAFALALSSAPSIGPRANFAEGVLGLAGRTAGKDAGVIGRSTLRYVDPAQALTVLLQSYGVVMMDAATIKDAKARADAAEAAHEHGYLFQLPLLIAEFAELADAPQSAPRDAASGVPSAGRTLSRVAAKTGRAKLTMRERVQGFANAVADEFRAGIADARKANSRATASVIGLQAEKTTLQKLPALAKKWGLDANRIFVGSVPVGVTGPKGGVISAEAASKFYKFMIELKKSPKAVRGYQAFAQLLAIDEGFNFPRGGTYFRIYGEGFPKGQGMHVHEAPTPRQTPRPRGR